MGVSTTPASTATGQSSRSMSNITNSTGERSKCSPVKEQPMPQPPPPDLTKMNLDELVNLKGRCSAEQALAQQVEATVDAEIIERVGRVEEGTVRTKTDLGISVSIQYSFNRKLDVDAWNRIKSEVPAELAPIRTKTELSLTQLRALERANPQLYKYIAGTCITSTDAKPSIKFKVS